jgi:uncharacterized protein (TIGR02271 family)
VRQTDLHCPPNGPTVELFVHDRQENIMGPQELVGNDVYDTQGEKVGRVATVYVNDSSHQPEWVTVHTGLFGHKESFVPLAGARSGRDGLRVGWTKDMIKEAPRIDADGRLSDQESDGLYQYYGLPSQRTGTTGTTGKTGRTDRTGRSGDQVMTRSEERLNVGTKRVEGERVRLRKYVVTEEQQVTVPVTHEEIRLEREPVSGRMDGRAEIGEDEQEVVLHREEPVVSKESVPVEQVRMRTEQVTEQQKVQGKVRKERIDVDRDKRA